MAMFDKDYFMVPAENMEAGGGGGGTGDADQLKADLLSGAVVPYEATVCSVADNADQLKNDLLSGAVVVNLAVRSATCGTADLATNAISATSATTATTATNATNAVNATNATNATTAANATQLKSDLLSGAVVPNHAINADLATQAVSLTTPITSAPALWRYANVMTSTWQLTSSHVGSLIILQPTGNITFYLMSTVNPFTTDTITNGQFPIVDLFNWSGYTVTINNTTEAQGLANIVSRGGYRTIQPGGTASCTRLGNRNYPSLTTDILLVGALQTP